GVQAVLGRERAEEREVDPWDVEGLVDDLRARVRPLFERSRAGRFAHFYADPLPGRIAMDVEVHVGITAVVGLVAPFIANRVANLGTLVGLFGVNKDFPALILRAIFGARFTPRAPLLGRRTMSGRRLRLWNGDPNTN